MDSDAHLVQRVQNGERAAFEALILRYERSVRYVATAFLADHHAAEDATQETFVAAFRALSALRGQEKFGPWLMQIARRVSGKLAQQRQRLAVPVPSLEATDPASHFDAPQRQRLITLLERLPEREQLVVTMRYFDGHSVQEIAEITNRPLGTVTKQLSRAYERLREWFAQSEEVKP